MQSNPAPTNNTRDRLLQKFGSNLDLLALGSAVSRAVELASSDGGATHALANCLLSDVALTQKILRLANTVFYRTHASGPVTTVSRAIFLLGFDTVKITALTMLLVDRLSNSKHAATVRTELIDALCASLVGRELARQSYYQGAEEASIASLFKNLGRLLLASHEHTLYKEIAGLTESGQLTAAQASFQVIGCSFDFLTEAVLREWNMPEAIIHAINPLPSGRVSQSNNRQEWMRQVACFSAEAAKLIIRMDDSASSVAGQALLARFGQALHLGQDKYRELVTTVENEIHHLVESCDLAAKSSAAIDAPAEVPLGLPAALQFATMGASCKHEEARHASGKPVNARDLLLAGIQDATQMMTSGRCKPHELMLLVLETLYSAMGFRFATICLKDPACNLFLSTMSIGEHHAVRQARFVFPAAPEADLFHLAMENNVDLTIADAATDEIRALLPAWHRTLLPDARSMIVLPLVVQKVQLGVFYGDRIQPAPEGVASDESALIKTLKGQLLAALHAR